MPFDQEIPLLRYYPLAKLMYLYKDTSKNVRYNIVYNRECKQSNINMKWLKLYISSYHRILQSS